MKRSRPLIGMAAVAAAALTFSLVPSLSASPAAVEGDLTAAQECPAGMILTTKTPGERAFEQGLLDPAFQEIVGELNEASADMAPVCAPARAPEPFAERMAVQQSLEALSVGPQGFLPQGALRAAVAGKQAAAANAAEVPGAQGEFTPLGTTPLIADEEGFDGVNGLGLADLAGRVDSFAYDDVNERLFAAPGTGGVYVSTDLGGLWTSVGDSLPYQSVGSIAWSPEGDSAEDGTLLVLSGEASAGGNVYTGLGGFFSTDNGQTWEQSTGIPDGLMGFEIEVDPIDPTVVYAATSQGLFRSADTGRTYANVVLPTGSVEGPDGVVECAGTTGYDNLCQNANWVTDVVIKEPGGVGEDTAGGTVMAAVGYRAGTRDYPGTGTPQSPQNGLYRSETGEVGSFEFLADIYSSSDASPDGFATRDRVGRTEFGMATGPEQDHDYLYAIVEDAVLFNGGLRTIDAPDPSLVSGPNNTVFNGIYVSADFGDSWTRMADEEELQLPITESALIGLAQTALFFAPGLQAWYNMWIEPDPTMATEAGVPTRLTFGLEEVWESRRSGSPQDFREAALDDTFVVIGPYFAGESCMFLNTGTPFCPTSMTDAEDTTTHPDHQGAIYIPSEDGGVSLVVGHDGGVNVQTVGPDEDFGKDKWGRGNQNGFHTLLPYDATIAKDGTVWFGLQDNGTAKIQPEDGKQIMGLGGDGFFTAVDPDNSDIAYGETTFAAIRVTVDGGRSFRSIRPPVSRPMFGNPFVMDPTDANHLLTAGPEVVERLEGPAGGWVEVFDLDEGNEGEPRQMTAVELEAAAAYVGFCSTCDIINKDPAKGQIFQNGLATNVGGDAPPEKGSEAGWHFATAEGLPDRYITAMAVDPDDPETLYVTLAGYANRQWWPPGAFNDANPSFGEGHVYKSTDAGESFTDITGDIPDVPARSLELNGDQLVVGTDVGVFLSDDTDGTTWAALEGLPAVPVVSVGNHPGDPDRIVLATFGRGVYDYTFGDAPEPEPQPQPPLVVEARTIFDACPPDRVPLDSRDDDDGNVHEFSIDCMVWYEIAKGTSDTEYEPTIPVSREQMASFIARLIERSGGELPADAPDAFSDDNGSIHEANINKLAAAGVVAGKGDGSYDPRGTVRRDQMAKFLVQGYEFRSDEEIVVAGDYFDDDNGNVHEVNINKSAAAGFTGGRDGGYDPTADVLRDQMASFLARVLDLLVEEGTAQAKQ